MELSIIIVNWNSVDYLRECLSSIYRETGDLEFEIIVVDNASFDGSEAMLEAEYQSVKFIQSSENGGFACANNLGFRHSSGKNVLFLNPDTLVIGPAIKIMLSQLEAMPQAGAVGCKLLHTDRSVQLHSVQRYPTVLNQILDIHFLKSHYPKWRIWGLRPLINNNHVPEPVEVIPGACLMVRRDVFEQVGLFTEDYFMYAEDIDLCYKINQTGRGVFFIDDAEVLHHGGGSSRNHEANCFQDVMTRESVYKFVIRTKGRCAAIAYRIAMLFSSCFRLLLLTALLPCSGWLGRKQHLYQAIYKWKNIFRWSVGLEKWARELK